MSEFVRLGRPQRIPRGRIMNSFKRILASACTILAMAGAAQANTVLADGFAPDATGNWSFVANSNQILSNPVVSNVAGTIDSYRIWVAPIQDFNTTMQLQLLGGHSTPFPSASDILATATFTTAEILMGRQVVSADFRNQTFYELVWDLSGFGITAAVAEEFYVRHGTQSLESISIAGNDTRRSGGVGADTNALLFGSPQSLGAGTVRNSLAFSFFVNDGSSDPVDPVDPDIAPVPLPAGLPLLLVGLGGFALLRRRQS
ncbi:VPLPA-CTERM sorting domain-containing protein [Gymnodinialimonas sp. 2305UL16-5]|uniref:VPLPA-CTERM sorting domain-containing protein n=1 Tax=Gymnodinialimonas mytili TaxID=3126503 RepID=UPI00309536FB